MTVDAHGIEIDLSDVPGTLVDPTITKVEWGPITVNGEMREGGAIYRQDGGKQPFSDRNLLTPYLSAYAKRKAELLA